MHYPRDDLCLNSLPSVNGQRVSCQVLYQPKKNTQQIYDLPSAGHQATKNTRQKCSTGLPSGGHQIKKNTRQKADTRQKKTLGKLPSAKNAIHSSLICRVSYHNIWQIVVSKERHPLVVNFAEYPATTLGKRFRVQSDFCLPSVAQYQAKFLSSARQIPLDKGRLLIPLLPRSTKEALSSVSNTRQRSRFQTRT